MIITIELSVVAVDCSNVSLESFGGRLAALRVGVLGEAELCGEVRRALRVAHHGEACSRQNQH